jgi:hypothetical protein
MPKQTDGIMIPDKTGRLICIDERPGGWKLTPRERDTIYQEFLGQFPRRDWTTARASDWVKLEADRRGLSPKRIRDFISEAIAAENGRLDRSWGWWVGCSRQTL